MLHTKNTFMTTTQVATHIGISASWLEKARCYDYGPPFYKVSGKVLYRETDVENWMATCRRVPNGGGNV